MRDQAVIIVTWQTSRQYFFNFFIYLLIILLVSVVSFWPFHFGCCISVVLVVSFRPFRFFVVSAFSTCLSKQWQFWCHRLEVLRVKLKLKPTGIVKKTNSALLQGTRRCNTIENIHIHKVIAPWHQDILVRETEAIMRKVPLVWSPKQEIYSCSCHFHIPLIFCSLLSQPCSIRDFFLFLIQLYLFSSWKFKKMSSA